MGYKKFLICAIISCSGLLMVNFQNYSAVVQPEKLHNQAFCNKAALIRKLFALVLAGYSNRQINSKMISSFDGAYLISPWPNEYAIYKDFCDIKSFNHEMWIELYTDLHKYYYSNKPLTIGVSLFRGPAVDLNDVKDKVLRCLKDCIASNPREYLRNKDSEILKKIEQKLPTSKSKLLPNGERFKKEEKSVAMAIRKKRTLNFLSNPQDIKKLPTSSLNDEKHPSSISEKDERLSHTDKRNKVEFLLN